MLTGDSGSSVRLVAVRQAHQRVSVEIGLLYFREKYFFVGECTSVCQIVLAVKASLGISW